MSDGRNPHMPPSIGTPCIGWSRMAWNNLFDASHAFTAVRSRTVKAESRSRLITKSTYVVVFDITSSSATNLNTVHSKTTYSSRWLIKYLSSKFSLVQCERTSSRLTFTQCNPTGSVHFLWVCCEWSALILHDDAFTLNAVQNQPYLILCAITLYSNYESAIAMASYCSLTDIH